GAIEQVREDGLLLRDQVGDAGLDAVLRDQVDDVYGALLSQPIDAPDALLQHRRVPRQLEIDAAVGGALQVQANAPGVAQEQHAGARIVVKLDDGLLSQFARLGTGEEQGSLASVGQHITYAPLGKAQHVAPLTEHDD